MAQGLTPVAHQGVLLSEVIDALSPLKGQRVTDGTFGAGGYSRALLDQGAKVCAIDRDPVAESFAVPLQSGYPDMFRFSRGRFAELDTLCGYATRIILDIGVSSMQLDKAARGFSFMRDGPLDMRMSGEGMSAADLVNKLPERRLADIFYGLGEEPRSRALAKTIVAARERGPIRTTFELASIITSVIHPRAGEIHPATRAFQALRIAVNSEFSELVEALFAAERILPAGGILAVVTFHSLEDRIVKRFFRPDTSVSRHMPARDIPEPSWADVRKPVHPGETEIARNPRSRSATLRSAVRSTAPARELSYDGLGVPEIALADF